MHILITAESLPKIIFPGTGKSIHIQAQTADADLYAFRVVVSREDFSEQVRRWMSDNFRTALFYGTKEECVAVVRGIHNGDITEIDMWGTKKDEDQ